FGERWPEACFHTGEPQPSGHDIIACFHRARLTCSAVKCVRGPVPGMLDQLRLPGIVQFEIGSNRRPKASIFGGTEAYLPRGIAGIANILDVHDAPPSG